MSPFAKDRNRRQHSAWTRIRVRIAMLIERVTAADLTLLDAIHNKVWGE
jgi:hypothetical protein